MVILITLTVIDILDKVRGRLTEPFNELQSENLYNFCEAGSYTLQGRFFMGNMGGRVALGQNGVEGFPSVRYRM
ncbi:unnamed protein product [Brugia timori]|uniref:DNA-directed RNA polymerase n=1 Tax=Brugia timori TaxID=42155 RepID=A0A0R3QCV4_9BILA|nr:unnamed protein product [Brugia timori]